MFRQIAAVTSMNLRSLPQRPLASLVTVIGVATTVAVMIFVLSISAGIMQSAHRNDNPNLAIVLSAGAAAEYMGAITRSEASIIADAPGVKHDASGAPIVQPQALVIVDLTKRSDGGPANIGFRGTGAQGLAMTNKFRIIAGRMYRPAVRELVAGKAASAQFKNMGLGDHVKLRGSEWTVVGIYDANGGIEENGLLADADTVIAAFDRTAYQSVGVELKSPADYNRFKDALTSNPQLSVDVKHTSDYFNDQLKQVTTVVNFVGYFVGGVMAVGAIFGSLNTMYSAVDARAREIATLRALGFGGTAVIVSVMVEALLLAIPGALLGALLAWLLFNGQAGHISGLTFPLAVTPPLVVAGIVLSVVIGLIGGFLPSIRAARMPVATALRGT